MGERRYGVENLHPRDILGPDAYLFFDLGPTPFCVNMLPLYVGYFNLLVEFFETGNFLIRICWEAHFFE
jgi:hypothetical protein